MPFVEEKPICAALQRRFLGDSGSIITLSPVQQQRPERYNPLEPPGIHDKSLHTKRKLILTHIHEMVSVQPLFALDMAHNAQNNGTELCPESVRLRYFT